MPARPNGTRAVAAIRLLALTGCRRSEVLNLRWRDIGADAISLPDTKTGAKIVILATRRSLCCRAFRARTAIRG